MSRAQGGLEAGARTMTVVLGVLALSLGGCFSEHPSEVSNPGTTVSFATEIQPVFNSGCAFSGCHATPNANPVEKPMVLTASQAYDQIVGVASGELPSMQRIRPGQPDQSYLILKLQNTHRSAGGSGDQMPLGQGALAQTTIDRIRLWVTQGAARN